MPIHIPVEHVSKSEDVAVIVGLTGPDGKKVFVVNTKIENLLALGLPLRRSYE